MSGYFLPSGVRRQASMVIVVVTTVVTIATIVAVMIGTVVIAIRATIAMITDEATAQ
jgi:hypothetical protein